MKTAAITWWIISVLLVVVSEGQSSAQDLSETQKKALENIMKHFHNKDHIRNGFIVSSINESIETAYSSGIFVNLELALIQTSCHKSLRANTDCALVKNGRTFNCFACFKFAYNSEEIVSQLIDCVGAHHVDAKRISSRNRSCKEVELKIGSEKVGRFGFLISQ